MSNDKTYVIGVGMTKFDKPGTKTGDYPDWAKEAGEKALADAGVPYDSIEQAYAGYVYGDSSYGQRAVYELGLTGIPVLNVNNNCSTGSTALYLAAQSIRGGLADCVIALGFEKMQPGSLGGGFGDPPGDGGGVAARIESGAVAGELAVAVRDPGRDLAVRAIDRCGR